MLRLIRLAIMGLAMLAHPAPASAQSPSAPRLVLACAPCHGFDGVGNDNSIPNLAGQHPDYLRNQLSAFRGGQRIHPTMNFFSGQMTREELSQIVEYYSALPRP
jgi:cytochrome c553